MSIYFFFFSLSKSRLNAGKIIIITFDRQWGSCCTSQHYRNIINTKRLYLLFLLYFYLFIAGTKKNFAMSWMMWMMIVGVTQIIFSRWFFSKYLRIRLFLIIVYVFICVNLNLNWNWERKYFLRWNMKIISKSFKLYGDIYCVCLVVIVFKWEDSFFLPDLWHFFSKDYVCLRKTICFVMILLIFL